MIMYKLYSIYAYCGHRDLHILEASICLCYNDNSMVEPKDFNFNYSQIDEKQDKKANTMGCSLDISSRHIYKERCHYI